VPDLPWEFVVVGVPASLQSRTHRRQGWKKIVAREARIAWGLAPPLKCKARFEMIFYYEGLRADVDNIIKYTQRVTRPRGPSSPATPPPSPQWLSARTAPWPAAASTARYGYGIPTQT
jgi:hypothetical protein